MRFFPVIAARRRNDPSRAAAMDACRETIPAPAPPAAARITRPENR